jgi:hypothetical protein
MTLPASPPAAEPARHRQTYTDLFARFRDDPKWFKALRNRLVNRWASRLNEKAEAAGFYTYVDEPTLLSKKKSDTVFVFGSGFSINQIDTGAWARISAHDTISFNWFIYQDFCDIDYHVIRETFFADTAGRLKQVVRHYAETLEKNGRYAGAALLIQKGRTASSGNAMIGSRLIDPRRMIYRFETASRDRLAPPSTDWAAGLAHNAGTLCDSVNFAILGGWKHIVLVGVDLYDRRYFWLGHDELSRSETDLSASIDTPHSNLGNGMFEALGAWSAWARDRGIVISVYNPRSLLTAVLPVYTHG